MRTVRIYPNMDINTLKRTKFLITQFTDIELMLVFNILEKKGITSSKDLRHMYLSNGTVAWYVSESLALYRDDSFESFEEDDYTLTSITLDNILTEEQGNVTSACEDILDKVSAKHGAEWLVQNRTSWSLAQEVLRLRGEMKALQENLINEVKEK